MSTRQENSSLHFAGRLKKWPRLTLTRVRPGASKRNDEDFLPPVCSQSPEKSHEEEEWKQQSSTVPRDNHTIEGEVLPRCA